MTNESKSQQQLASPKKSIISTRKGLKKLKKSVIWNEDI